MEKILEQIRDFADRAHGDQLRKYSPERYIVHPVRVMQHLQEISSNPIVLASALLHDVLEDTPTTANDISRYAYGQTGSRENYQNGHRTTPTSM